jgi:hypothetical protein
MESSMSFWENLEVFIQDSTVDTTDYHNSRATILLYLRKDKKVPWVQLSANMQNILFQYEKKSGYKGLTPTTHTEECNNAADV